MDEFPVDRYLRAARRYADVSQRELAEASGIPSYVIARMESTPRLARVQVFAQAVTATGLHLAIVDESGAEFEPEGAAGELRDRGRRRFPPHYDVRLAKDGWWGSMWPMFYGREPTYTFDRDRFTRDQLRQQRSQQRSQQRPSRETATPSPPPPTRRSAPR